MKYNFFMPTRVIHGENVVIENAQLLADLGKKALIVTGRTSGRVSGALDDVVTALEKAGVQHQLFDRIENNPSLSNVEEGGRAARGFKPDFIIAIGGGSPLDGAKAVAVLAANDIPAGRLFENRFDNKPLPIVAIPTTAGTGSEVTPYSILTDPISETKRSFTVPELFPKIAFLDYRYTVNLPESITLDTAVDALSHLVEGYLSLRAIDTSDMFAERGIRLWAQCISALKSREFTPQVRDMLLVASTLGGFTISHTGTTLVHALGYSLTYYHGVPHGRANGILMGEYLRFTANAAADRVKNVLNWMGFGSVDEFSELMGQLFGTVVSLEDDQIQHYASKAMKTRNVAFSRGDVTEQDLINILRKSL